MDIYELIKTRRTIRKYIRKDIPHDLLVKFIEYARFSPSGMNAQPVRYMLVEGEGADQVFPHTHYAGHLKGAHSPSFDERPAAFILFLVPKGKKPEHDVGAIAQSMGLMAHSEGLGSCWMGAIDRSKISAICAVPDEYEIDTLLALGYPAESPQTVDAVDGDTKYFLDDGGKLNVPKLDVDDLIL
jgi:nitroreductase